MQHNHRRKRVKPTSNWVKWYKYFTISNPEEKKKFDAARIGAIGRIADLSGPYEHECTLCWETNTNFVVFDCLHILCKS